MKEVIEVISLVAVMSLVTLGGYIIFEGEMVKGEATANVTVAQEVTGEITLSCATSVTGLTPIPGMTGGTSNGAFSCTSTTNDNEGYTLKLRKTGDLCHPLGCAVNQRFDDYPGTTTNPIDFNWTNAGPGAEYWGFNMTSGVDVIQRFRNASGPAAPCNTAGGIVSDGHCWVRIPTPVADAETVANRTSPTPPEGISSGFGIRIQAGPNNHLRSGTYNATLTVTATMN